MASKSHYQSQDIISHLHLGSTTTNILSKDFRQIQKYSELNPNQSQDINSHLHLGLNKYKYTFKGFLQDIISHLYLCLNKCVILSNKYKHHFKEIQISMHFTSAAFSHLSLPRPDLASFEELVVHLCQESTLHLTHHQLEVANLAQTNPITFSNKYRFPSNKIQKAPKKMYDTSHVHHRLCYISH